MRTLVSEPAERLKPAYLQLKFKIPLYKLAADRLLTLRWTAFINVAFLLWFLKQWNAKAFNHTCRSKRDFFQLQKCFKKVLKQLQVVFLIKKQNLCFPKLLLASTIVSKFKFFGIIFFCFHFYFQLNQYGYLVPFTSHVLFVQLLE